VSIDRSGLSFATANLGGVRLALPYVALQKRQTHAHEVGERHVPPPSATEPLCHPAQVGVRQFIDADGSGRALHGSTLASRQTRMTLPCVLTRSEVRTAPVHSHRNPSGAPLNTLPAALPRAA